MPFWKLGIAVITLLSLSVLGCSNKPTYTTYEDCLLAEIGESQTAAAIDVINQACRRKFPPTTAEIAVRVKIVVA